MIGDAEATQFWIVGEDEFSVTAAPHIGLNRAGYRGGARNPASVLSGNRLGQPLWPTTTGWSLTWLL